MLLFPLTCFPRCRLCSSSQPQAFPAPLLWAQSTDERLTEAGAKGGQDACKDVQRLPRTTCLGSGLCRPLGTEAGQRHAPRWAAQGPKHGGGWPADLVSL